MIQGAQVCRGRLFEQDRREDKLYRVPSVQGPKTTKLGFKSIKLGAKILIKLVLGLSWGALGGENSHKIGPGALLEGSWGHLGPKRAPRGPQEPTRAPKVPSWASLGPQVGGHVGLCWGYVGSFLQQVGGQKAILLNKKLKMAKVAPRCPNIALKYMISGLCWLA